MKKVSFIRKTISLTVAVGLLASPTFAIALSLSDMQDTLTTLTKDTAADHTIQFVTPTGIDADADTIIVTFESDFTLGSVEFGDIDMAYDADGTCVTFSNSLTLAATDGADQWGVAAAGQAITFDAPTSGGTIAAGRCVQIKIGLNASGGNAQITNPSTAGDYTVAFTGAFEDNGTTTVEILDDGEVQLTAEVPQSLTFSISAVEASFGNLNASAARYASSTGSGDAAEVVAHTLTAGTNASGGYTITATGTPLQSGANMIDPLGTAAASSPGDEQFGMRFVESGAGSGTVTAPYDGATYAFNATTTDQIASASASTENSVYSAYYLANITSNTPAGTYTSNITYVGTANY